MGVETEALEETVVSSFMPRLANELATLENHMTVGREYASIISLQAFAKALENGKCDHFNKVEIRDLNTYWKVLDEAHVAAKKIFDDYWCP
jgi:hypothetical protein